MTFEFTLAEMLKAGRQKLYDSNVRHNGWCTITSQLDEAGYDVMPEFVGISTDDPRYGTPEQEKLEQEAANAGIVILPMYCFFASIEDNTV